MIRIGHHLQVVVAIADDPDLTVGGPSARCHSTEIPGNATAVMDSPNIATPHFVPDSQNKGAEL